MLKQYLEDQHLSIYRLSQMAEVPYSSLNDFVNLKTDVESVSAGFLKKLADACGMTMDEMYELCSDNKFVIKRHQPVRIRIKDGKYFAEYEHDGNKYRCYVAKVNSLNTQNLHALTEMAVHRQIHNREVRNKLHVVLSHA